MVYLQCKFPEVHHGYSSGMHDSCLNSKSGGEILWNIDMHVTFRKLKSEAVVIFTLINHREYETVRN